MSTKRSRRCAGAAAADRAMTPPSRLAALALVIAACARSSPPPVVPKSPAPAPIAKPAEPSWPIRVAIRTWTDAGIITVGSFPDSPPAQLPTTPWFVEPIGPLDRPTFAKLVVALRRERVPGLALRGRAVAALLSELRELPALTALVLDDTDVTSLAALDASLTLARLYLARTVVSDVELEHLVTHQAQLEVLDLANTQIGDRGAAALARLTELRAIDLSGTLVTEFLGAPKLEVVDLGRTAIGRSTIDALAKLPLRHVFLDQTPTQLHVLRLAPLAPTLERLDVSGLDGKPLTDRDLEWLAAAPQLVEARLGGAALHDALVRKLLAIPTVRELGISESLITPKLAQAIARSRPELEELDLANTVADDATAASLLALPNLRVLRLDGTKLTDAGLANATPKQLVELYLGKTAITDRGAQLLDVLPRLEALSLAETKVSDPTFARIGNLAELHTLVLSKTRSTALAGYAPIAKLAKLGRLYLDDTNLGDHAAGGFAALSELRILHLGGSQVGDETLLTVLHPLAQLAEITLGDTRITALAVSDLSPWPRLQTVSLVGLAITDAHLPTLARHAPLATLDLSATDLTDPSPLLALPRLRTLGLSQTRLSPAGLAALKRFPPSVRVVR